MICLSKIANNTIGHITMISRKLRKVDHYYDMKTLPVAILNGDMVTEQ